MLAISPWRSHIESILFIRPSASCVCEASCSFIGGDALRLLSMLHDLEQSTRLKAALGDRYRIQRELGSGGMATVYLAEEPQHGRLVALKVLHPHLAATLGPDRFLREITLTANLTHPHILPLFDSGQADGYLFYTMPYVEGESLRDRLRREGQLPVVDALRITTEIADALGFAHSRNIVHRDVKPENVLLEEGHAVVADFGIAKAVRAASGDELTATGLVLGTAQYMSPEQAAGSTRLDGRSDMYSLGCVLYEMLAGDPPFTGSVRDVILARKALDTIPSVRALRDSVPRPVDEALTRSLARFPADRFRTMHEFVAALTAPGPASRPRGPGRLAPVPRGQEDHGTSMPMQLKPLLDELDVFAVTRAGQGQKLNPDHFLICSVGRYLSAHQTSLSDDTALPRMGERQVFLAMVAHGVGRGSWAQEASRVALEVLAQYMVHSVRCYYVGDESHDQVFVDAMREAANQCVANVAQKARENPEGRGMAATFSMWVGCWPRAYVLHVGGGSCFRLRGGNVTRVTADDYGPTERSPSSRTAVDSTSPAVYRLDQSWDTVVLLCTEELAKYVSQEQIQERLRGKASAGSVCDALIQDTYAAGATDSVTVVVGRTRPIVRQPA
jgi:serine/threonine protein kinase/serine/threonine protein phosphatase PrpC